MLELDSIIKSFGNQQILSDIYLRCEPGDIVGILGRNGTGKSTLLKILFGILPADNKFIRIDEEVLDHPFQNQDKICYLPQHDFLPKYLSIKKVAQLYLCQNAVAAFLDDPILNNIKSNKAGNLSGGELRYLEIKLLLFTPCKFLLLDELFNGLSPLMIDVVKELITKKSKEKGIILTDHDYQNVLDLANRYYVLFDGSLKAIKNKSELVTWGYLPESKK